MIDPVAVAFVALFTFVGTAAIMGVMFLLACWCDWSCARCLERDPKNDYCCD